MKDSALSIANYFVQISVRDGRAVKPLRLMKLVYLAHGYILSMLDRSCLNQRFDQVEAWKYGPVIPSVYHSFKGNKDKPITEPTVIITDEINGKPVTEVPHLLDKDARNVCVMVWNAYQKFSDTQLVDMLHADGTPWSKFYKEGENIIIPDEDTKSYCDRMAKEIFGSPVGDDTFTESDYRSYCRRGARILPCNEKWI